LLANSMIGATISWAEHLLIAVAEETQRVMGTA
jgi:hypothetical protein